jgi:predicted dehydrogenase
MLRVCVVGLGWWGKIMVRTLATSSRVRVVAAVEPELALGQSFCTEHGIRHLASYAQCIEAADVDAVILTTPNNLHEAQIIAAARAGKHVFCEKPLALTLASAQRSVQACLDHGVRLGIGHERRFEPPMLLMKQLLAEGRLGRLLQIEGNFSQDKFLALAPDNWRLSRAQAGCGPMTATGIHLLNLATSLAGPAIQVMALNSKLATGFESGDSVSAQLLFANGVSASINAMLSTPFYARFAIFGSKGWIEVRDKSHVENPSGWIVTRSTPNDGSVVQDFPVATPVLDNVEAFAAAVAAQQADYPIALQDMLDTTAALEAIAQSAETGVIVKPKESSLSHLKLSEGAE